MKDFYQKISYILEKTIKNEFGVDLEPPLWELPPKQEFGDLSSMAALKLASKLKKPPFEIAAHLKTILEKKLKGSVERIEIIKPAFINIFLSKEVLVDSLNSILKDKDKFFRHKIKDKILIEFVSANPTGPLSIAHGRQAVIGDVIANILDFCGNKVVREYYINDAGRQIDLLVASVEARIKELKGQNFMFPEDGYKGEYIRDVAKEISKRKYKDLRKEVLSHMLSLIKDDLESVGVSFSSWVSQEKLISSGAVDKVISLLKKKGLIYEKEGAVWFASTKFGDDKDRVIKKADGELTYFASDIAYHQNKIERKIEKLINLWGPDHHGYIGRVMAAMKALGFTKNELKIIIIQLVTLKTKERMSKRAGTALLLSDLVADVGKDATRFYYITRKNSSHLEFDIDQAKEASFNNPLYYIQYACARIESIFKKAKGHKVSSRYSKYLSDSEEISLLRFLLQFSYCLEKAYYSLEPVFIIEYLRELASVLHKFYERKRVLDEDKDVSGARLNLIEATKIVLHCGLNVLGIKPVKKM